MRVATADKPLVDEVEELFAVGAEIEAFVGFWFDGKLYWGASIGEGIF